MQVTRATFIPLLAPATTDRMAPDIVRDEYSGDLTVVYTFGPQFGRRVVTRGDLEQLQMTPRNLRRAALDHLEVLSSRAEFHGQPPALMLSFEGLESSLLLANDFWTRLQGAVPGHLVVGVPCRDVVIVTGSMSQTGLEKARRCVERMFFAGGDHLLTRSLLIRRGDTWEPFDKPARQAGRPNVGPAHQHGTGQPPRQFQEHPSWPGERVAAVRPAEHRMPPAGRPAAAAMGPAAMGPMPMGPAHTGSMPALPTHTGSMPAIPTHTGSMPALPTHTGSMPAVPAAAHGPGPVTDHTGFQPPAAPRQRMRRRAAHTDVAQYSAVPYSAMPYSASPSPYLGAPQSPAPQPMSPYAASQYAAAQAAAQYSAVPYSAVPYSAMPYSAVPNSGSPYSIAPNRSTGAHADRKPDYRDDQTSTSSSLPRPLYPEYDRVPDRSPQDTYGRQDPYSSRDRDAYERPAEPAMPEYPASWGSAPSSSPARSEFRSGPRARFAR